MEYLLIISYYLIFGLLVCLVTEFCVNQVEQFLIESNEEDEIIPWGNAERILTLIFWPYTIFIFAAAITKYILNKQK